MYADLRNQGSAKGKISRDMRNSIDKHVIKIGLLIILNPRLHDNNSCYSRAFYTGCSVVDETYFQKNDSEKGERF